MTQNIVKIANELQKRWSHAKKEHPEGSTWAALLAEVAEYGHEVLTDNKSNQRDELLDIAAICLRLIEQLDKEWKN